MAKVRLLEKTVAERIAAGEVVERPSSIVKELVENSLDAGASRITVEMKSGGIKMLRVTDNGCGMASDDLALSVRRFATSKISSWDDMASLSTLGFRGEALPSIAAVSRLSIKSCPPGQESGAELCVEGAGVPLIKPCACPPGTRIEVNDLFYNTPARLKFLRSPVTEAANIIDLLGRMAVSRPDVHFRLISNDKEVFSFPVGMNMAQRLAKLWKIPDGALIPIGRDNGSMSVDGFIALPSFTRNNRNNQLILLNGRIIKSSNLSQAMLEGYTPLLPRGRFPVGVLRLFLPPDSFDVNAHPNKLEVRFVDTRPIFSMIFGAVAEALEEHQADTVQERHLDYSLGDAPQQDQQKYPTMTQALQGAKTEVDRMPASRPEGAEDPLTAPAAAEENDIGLLGILNRVEAVNANQLAISASEKALAREGCSSKKLKIETNDLNKTVTMESPQKAAHELAAYGLLSEQSAPIGLPREPKPVIDGAATISISGFSGSDTLSCVDPSGKVIKPPTPEFSGRDTMGFAVIPDAPQPDDKPLSEAEMEGVEIVKPPVKAELPAALEPEPLDPNLVATIYEPVSFDIETEGEEDGSGALSAPQEPEQVMAVPQAPAPVLSIPVNRNAPPQEAAQEYRETAPAEPKARDKAPLMLQTPLALPVNSRISGTQTNLFETDDAGSLEIRGSRFKLFGQVHNTFIVGLVDGELWVIDQHTAHERINYERLGHLSPLSGRSQALLVPMVMEFSPAASEYLEGSPEELSEFGFEVEPFGVSTFQLRAVPAGLSEKRISAVFRDLIEELVGGSISIRHSVREMMRERLRAMASCKAAVKAGDALTREDMQKLVDDMLQIEHSRYCPHGRPTRVKLDQRTLERLFHR